MKKRWLILPIFILILIFTILPVSFISANPGNLVINGDFSDGLNGWLPSTNTASVVVWLVDETIEVGPTHEAAIQTDGFIVTSKKNLTYSVDVFPVTYDFCGNFLLAFNIYDSSNNFLGYGNHGEAPPTGEWTNISKPISEMWSNVNATELPDFYKIRVWAFTRSGCVVRFDNFKLTYPETEVGVAWTRTMPMTCWQVWINEDNNFQFIFWYPYKDKNWVRIYDMENNMVFEVDLPKKDPNLIVDLPDGMYMVKTYHDQELLQEFMIGKP